MNGPDVIIQAIRQTKYQVSLASWQSCRVKISKFCNFEFWLALKRTDEKISAKETLVGTFSNWIWKNVILKMAFSKFKCSQNYFKTSLLARQFMFTIILKLWRHLLFRVNNKNSRTKCEICSNLTTKG